MFALSIRSSRTRRSTKLSHSPNWIVLIASTRGVRSNSLRAGSALPRDTPQKFLAQDTHRLQARRVMGTFARSPNRGRALIAICVSAGFVCALALSASPQLHHRVHKDANRVEHNCAATMIASGSYNHAAHVPLVSAPAPPVQFSKVPALTPCWVQSPFLGACIFEHAPPARA